MSENPERLSNMPLPAPDRPPWWPRFRSTLRSTAVTARVGRILGIAIGICFLTGLLSHYQYHPWSWLPEPASPVWAYRVTQGLHVAVGIATIPLVLLKLWTVYPNLFRWPPVRSLKKAIERGTVAILVASTLVQLATGFLNVLNWYPFPWFFPPVHRFLGYVVVGSVLLHVAVKLPDIVYGLQTKIADGDVLTEIPWDENPDSHSNAGPLPPPATPALSRRGVLTAAGAGIGVVIVTSVGQTLTPLEPLGLLAVRRPSTGPQGVPVNRTADQAKVAEAATAASWTLQVEGPRPFALSLVDVEALAAYEARLPITCVEGWSVNARGAVSGCLTRATSRGGRRTPGQFPLRRSGGLQPLGDVRAAASACAAGHPPERGTAESRPRLSAAADRPEPSRRAQHQVARPHRGAVMGRWRAVLAVAGILLGLFGFGRLVTQVPVHSLIGLAIWLVAALIIHDGIASPLIIAVGALLAGVPPRGRRYLQAGMITGVMITVVAAPMIVRQDSQPLSKAI